MGARQSGKKVKTRPLARGFEVKQKQKSEADRWDAGAGRLRRRGIERGNELGGRSLREGKENQQEVKDPGEELAVSPGQQRQVDREGSLDSSQ